MISTKNLGGSGFTPKTLQPGSQSIKVNSISLDKVPFLTDGYNLNLYCEGPDLGEAFEGFWINKDDQSKGKHKGQVGRIRSHQYAYADATVNGKQIYKNDQILRFLNNLCEVTGCSKWFEDIDGKFPTVEAIVEELNSAAPFKDVYFNAVVAGKEYENKEGYTNYDLFLPKFTKDGVPMEAIGTTNSRLFEYNEENHIIRKVPKTVEEFSGDAPAEEEDDFNLED